MKKILIIEDEISIQKSLSKRLEGLGYEVIIASDGTEALKKAELNDPDLILLDIVLPKMNGFEVLEKLRIGMNYGKPIIVLSNLTGDNDKAQALNLGVEHYLSKADTSLSQIGQIVSSTLSP